MSAAFLTQRRWSSNLLYKFILLRLIYAFELEGSTKEKGMWEI